MRSGWRASSGLRSGWVMIEVSPAMPRRKKISFMFCEIPWSGNSTSRYCLPLMEYFAGLAMASSMLSNMRWKSQPSAERDAVAQPLPDHLQAFQIQRRVELEMLARMGSAHDVRYPILHRHFGHGHRDFDIATVRHPGQTTNDGVYQS